MPDLDPPATLTDTQRATWQATVTRLNTARTTTRVDPHSLHTYVIAVDTWTQANDLLRQSRPLVTRGDKVLPNPALQVMTQAAQTINSFARTYRLNWAPAMQPAADQPGHAGDSLPCDRCGAVHNPRNCSGHRRSDGQQCTLPRGARTDHLGFGCCAHHGGMTPSGKAAATAEHAQRSIFKLASRGEVTAMRDPLGAIAEMAAERRQWADAATELLNRQGSLTGEDSAGREQLRALVPLMVQLTDRALHAAKVMAELDIDERLVSIQAQATDRVVEQVNAAIDTFLTSLRDRLAPLLAPGASWPGDGELAELMDGALAQVGG